MTKHSQVFHGIGKLKNFQLHLHIDNSVTPVAQAPRRIPFSHPQSVQAKLDELETLGIIEPVKGPTPGVASCGRSKTKWGHPRLCRHAPGELGHSP